MAIRYDIVAMCIHSSIRLGTTYLSLGALYRGEPVNSGVKMTPLLESVVAIY